MNLEANVPPMCLSALDGKPPEQPLRRTQDTTGEAATLERGRDAVSVAGKTGTPH